MPDLEPKSFAHPFPFCPGCGQDGLEWPTIRHCQCPVCGFDYFLNVATAVATVLSDDEGRILALVRAKDPGRGMLGLPGGFVDAGESLEEAARREIREEIGIEVGPLEFLASFPNSYLHGGITYAVVDAFFTGRFEETALDLERGEVQAVDFLKGTPDELRRFVFHSNRMAVERVLFAKQNQ